jgi:hypothetical protein
MAAAKGGQRVKHLMCRGIGWVTGIVQLFGTTTNP